MRMNKMRSKSRKLNNMAAIELSIGTIVIVVLAMSMLILGLVLVKSIFSGATSIADMTNDQLKNQMATMFGENKKLVLYPDSRQVTLKQGTVDGFGVGIKNLLEGSSDTVKFDYEVSLADKGNCDVNEKEALSWIVTGKTEDNMGIASGDFVSRPVKFNVPVGSALCTLRYKVEVKANNQNYASDVMDVTIKSK